MTTFKDFVNKKHHGDKEAYQAFFNKKLKEYGVSSPDELSDEKKKRFFNEVDRAWVAEKDKLKSD